MSQIGPVITDLIGTELTSEDAEMLAHPLIGGVILFARNYEHPEQIKHFCKEIRKARSEPLLITVDQEGGRVQRFLEGFTKIPPMGSLGSEYDSEPNKALQSAEHFGFMMASELLKSGIDLSFAPVLDLNKKLNNVVGDRSFHREPDVVFRLAEALIRGMNRAGMQATAKHFPGHGSVDVDSHLGLPIDNREFNAILQDDLQPFLKMVRNNIPALMAAHILFPAVDEKPVSFSKRWLQDILRKELHFSGIIFSDDLNMKGAQPVNGFANRAFLSLEAGCDMVLICNNRNAAIEMIDELPKNLSVDIFKFNKVRGQF